MKKLLFSLLVVWLSFFGFSFASNNFMIFESNYSNFKNDRIVIWTTNSLYNSLQKLDLIRWTTIKYPVYKLTDSQAITPFDYYYSGAYITGIRNSYQAEYPYDQNYGWSIQHWTLITWNLSNFWFSSTFVTYTFDPSTYSIWAFVWGWPRPNTYQWYSHWRDLNNFPNSSIENFKNSNGFISSASDVWTIRAIGYFNANIYNSSLLPNFDPEVVQYFNSDSVETYANWNQYVNASMWTNNSQYFLGNGNSWAWVTPNLTENWETRREDLFFATVEHQDNFSQYWFWWSIPSSYWILLLTVNWYSVNRNNYKNTILAISKDPHDPRNLLAWIYPNCNCTSIDCLNNYCTPSKVWHLIGEIDTNPSVWNVTCSSTGISTLLPFNVRQNGVSYGTFWTVNLNDVDNYYSGNYLDDSACNPIPNLLFSYFHQVNNKKVLPDIILNWDFICFNGDWNSLSPYCVQLVSSTSISPIAWASAQYSGMGLLGSLVDTYNIYSWWSTAGYVMQVVSQIENTYWYIQQDCNSGAVIYTGVASPYWASYSLLPYYSWRDLATQRLRVYCYYSEQLIVWGYPEALTDNEWNIDDLLYWSWVNAWTIFNCPSNYQATTNISLKISNFPWLSILNWTVLWNIDLIKPVACLIWAFNYWFDNVWFSSNQNSMLSNFQNLNTNKVFGTSLWNSSRVDIWWFTHLLGLLLVAPALYLAFKRLS